MAESSPKWFVWNAYLNNKLAQVNSDPTTKVPLTMDSLVIAMNNAGFKGPEGYYMHFLQYGHKEDVSPSAGFDATQYYTFKAAKEYHAGDVSKVNSADISTIKQAIADAGMDAWTHYQKYGTAEMINASNSFDTAAYLQAKAAAMGSGWDAAKVATEIQNAGMNAYEHYMKYKGTAPNEVDDTATYEVSVNNQASVPGQTFTLTNGIDNFVGTSGNDTFLAGQDNGQNALSAGDQIDGGAGTDTLKIYTGTGNFAAATVKNVEIVEVYENAGLDVVANTDVKQVWSIGGAGKTIDANVGQVVGFGNQATGGASKAAFANVAGTADAATIAVKDAGKTTAYTSITVGGIETLTVQAEGTNKLGNLTADKTDTLVVTGAGTLDAVATGGGTFKVVDASANTGGVTLDISGALANDIKVTGGAGNDEITVDYTNLTKADKIDLGAGTADVLGFATTNVVFNDAATVGLLAGVSNVEGLKINVALTSDIDAALVSQSNFIINSTGKAALTNLANTDTVTYSAATNVGNTLALELGQNTLNLKMAGGAAAASGTTTVTGSTTVNIESTGKAGVAQNTLALTTPDNNTFNITGSQDLKLTVTGAGTVTGQTVDATAFTGKLDVTGTAIADVIKGGSGSDTITGGKGADILTGNGGADTFVFDGTAGATQSGATFGMFDTITDFVVGTDKLQFANVADVVSGQQAAVQAAVSALAAGSSATAIATAMAGANTTNLGVSFAVFEGNTYVLYETLGTGAGVAADDVFIKLAGVTTLPTFAADVIA